MISKALVLWGAGFSCGMAITNLVLNILHWSEEREHGKANPLLAQSYKARAPMRVLIVTLSILTIICATLTLTINVIQGNRS